MTRTVERHTPTYEFTGLSWWCSCSCGWRSGLRVDRSEIVAQHRRHVEDA